MPADPPLSRAVYLRRRLVVGLVAVVLLGGGAVAATQVLDSDDDTGGAVAGASTTDVAATTSGAPATSVAEPESATTTVDTSPASVVATDVETDAETDAEADTTITSSTSVATTGVPTTRAIPTIQTPTQAQDDLATDPSAPVIEAAAYGAYDSSSGTWLTATNSDLARPVGSIVKLLTAHVVMEAGDPTKVVTVPALTLDAAESAIGLYTGEQLPRDVLLRAMLIVSANDAAEALAVDIGGTRDGFVDMMNGAADDLGLDGTVASNPSGLDGGGAVSTVRDCVTLAAELLQDETFRATVARTSASLHGQTFPATNDLLGIYPGADGIKTGSTTQAGFGIVASATRNGRTIIVVVLGAPSDGARFVQAAALLDWAFAQPA